MSLLVQDVMETFNGVYSHDMHGRTLSKKVMGISNLELDKTY